MGDQLQYTGSSRQRNRNLRAGGQPHGCLCRI